MDAQINMRRKFNDSLIYYFHALYQTWSSLVIAFRKMKSLARFVRCDTHMIIAAEKAAAIIQRVRSSVSAYLFYIDDSFYH